MSASVQVPIEEIEIGKASLSQLARDLIDNKQSIRLKLEELDEENRQKQREVRERHIEDLEEGREPTQLDTSAFKTNNTMEFEKDILKIFSSMGLFNNKLRKMVEKHAIPLNKKSLASEDDKSRPTYAPIPQDLFSKIFTDDADNDKEIELQQPRDLEYGTISLLTFSDQSALQVVSSSSLVTVHRKQLLSNVNLLKLAYSAGNASFVSTSSDRRTNDMELFEVNLQNFQKRAVGLKISNNFKLGNWRALELATNDTAVFAKSDKAGSNIYWAKELSEMNPFTIDKNIRLDDDDRVSMSDTAFKDFASEEFPFATYKEYVAIATQQDQKIKASIESHELEKSSSADTGLRFVTPASLKHFGIHVIKDKPILLALDSTGGLFAQRVDEPTKKFTRASQGGDYHYEGLFVQESRQAVWLLKRRANDAHSLTLEPFSINENTATLTGKGFGPEDFVLRCKTAMTPEEQIRFGVLSSTDGNRQALITFSLHNNLFGYAEFLNGKLQGKYSEDVFLSAKKSKDILTKCRMFTCHTATGEGATAQDKERVVVAFSSTENNNFSGVIDFKMKKNFAPVIQDDDNMS